MRGERPIHTIFNSKIRRSERLTLERNVEIVTGSEKKKFVRINDIRFHGKRSIDWRQREYLKDYVDSVFGGWKKYLYDILDIKKETSNSLSS